MLYAYCLHMSLLTWKYSQWDGESMVFYKYNSLKQALASLDFRKGEFCWGQYSQLYGLDDWWESHDWSTEVHSTTKVSYFSQFTFLIIIWSAAPGIKFHLIMNSTHERFESFARGPTWNWKTVSVYNFSFWTSKLNKAWTQSWHSSSSKICENIVINIFCSR